MKHSITFWWTGRSTATPRDLRRSAGRHVGRKNSGKMAGKHAGPVRAVVESVAWSVCGVVGLDTSANSIPYLAAWSENTDLAILERTASLINRLANRIEDAFPGEQRQGHEDQSRP